MEKEAGKQGKNRRVICSDNPDQQKKINRMKNTEAHIGDLMLNGLKFGEIAEHSPDVEAPGPYYVEEVVVYVNEDAAYGEEQKP